MTQKRNIEDDVRRTFLHNIFHILIMTKLLFSFRYLLIMLIITSSGVESNERHNPGNVDGDVVSHELLLHESSKTSLEI